MLKIAAVSISLALVDNGLQTLNVRNMSRTKIHKKQMLKLTT